MICFKKSLNDYLKAKKSLHITRFSSYGYLFIVFFNSVAKIFVHRRYKYDF